MKDDKILHKWINGQLKGDALEEFKKRPEYESLETLYRNTDHLTAPSFEEKEMLSSILKKKKSTGPQAIQRSLVPSWLKYAAAAMIALMVGFFFWPSAGQEVSFAMANGEQMNGTLPDLSTFVLNAQSELAYNQKTWKEDRTLTLKGEAFFKVEKGSKFTVKTPNGTVQVLGTQFNVWSRNDKLEVKCTSGKVAVLNTKGQKLGELTANQAIALSEDVVEKNWEFQNSENTSWMNGISKFKNVSLSRVLNELERQFNVEFVSENINLEEMISCNFQHKNLDLALQTTLNVLNIKFEKLDGNKIRLRTE